MKTFTKTLCAAALATAGTFGLVAATSSEALAEKRHECRMKGIWDGKENDVFEFDAIYFYRDGADIFNGIYDNPGAGSKADVKGVATKGTWLILLTYTDAGHKGMIKELKGTGAIDYPTKLLKVEGAFRTLIGTSDIGKNGTFKLLGTCK